MDKTLKEILKLSRIEDLEIAIEELEKIKIVLKNSLKYLKIK